MEKLNFPKRFRVYFPLIVLFLMLVFLMPRSPKLNYDYKKGAPWMYETLVAQFDFPVLKTDSQLMEEREAAEAEMVPYFRLDSRVAYDAEMKVAAAQLGEHEYARKDISEAVSYIYSKGVLRYEKEQDHDLTSFNKNGLIYVQIGKRASKVPASEVLTLEQAEQMFRSAVATACQVAKTDSLISASGLGGIIVPDHLYDSQTTERVHKESIDNISATQGIVRSGDVIVSAGDIVTAETEQLLNSYKAEYETNVDYTGPVALQWAGNVIIAFSLVLLLFLAIFYSNSNIFEQYNKYLYLLMVFSMSVVASSLAARNDPALFYMIPFTLISLYLLAFFKKRVVYSVYVISLLPVLLFSPNGMEIFMMYLIAGIVGIQIFEYFNRGWLQFVTAFIVFLVLVTVWTGFRLIDNPDGIFNYHVVLNLALASFMSVAGYPLVYLFEKIFRLVSSSKLVELSDTSNKLLRELADKAPGTFQHCLQVMNLSDAAARSIDANVPLIRAGALYHDIGKILNPQCFTENEAAGVKYHAGLTPKESAQEIIKHVSDGLALAEKHGLPDELKDFIRTHHGTTAAGYFLTKYLNDGGDPSDIEAFHYNGMKPATKEQVILMLCDAVEAASRSLKDYTPVSISELVERIVNSKISEGQLYDAHISLKQINIVKEVIKTYLQQMYHSRIAYPKRLENTVK